MPHVWILNHYAQDISSAAGLTRHFSLGRRLAQHGWTVTILAASVEHNTGRQRLDPGEITRLETIDGVRFLWLRTNPHLANGAHRLRNMLAYTRLALRRATTRQLAAPTVVIGSSVHPFAAWAAGRLARRYAAKFIFEIRDLWPETLIDMGRLSRHHPAAVLMRRIESTLCETADFILTPLPNISEYLIPKGVAPAKIVWIPNGVDFDVFPPPPPLEPHHPFTFMYFGAHGSANGLGRLLEAMRILNARSASPLRLRLVGSGPAKAELMARASKLGLANVAFEDAVPKSGIAELGATADAFVFNLATVGVFRYGISSNKLFDYMACGRPIVFCAAAHNDPVSEAGAGVSAAPDAVSLADAMLTVSRTPREDLLRMGAAARCYVATHHDMDELAAKLARLLDAAAAGASPCAA